MGVLGKIRHGLGFHTGEWAFDTPTSCAQTRRCTGCPDVETRVRHEISDWALRLPRKANACTRERVCRRCAMVETDQVHVFEWYYLEEAPPGPGIAESFAALPDPTDRRHRCRQLSICEFCYATKHDQRTHHQWGSATPTFNGEQEYRCRRCDRTKRTPSPFNNQPGAFPGQGLGQGPGQTPGQGLGQ